MDVIKREQYYLDLLKPKYNILSKAGSSLGYKHTELSKEKMKGSRVLTVEHLFKIKEHITELNSKISITVFVLDLENNTKTEYPSIRSAARALNASDATLRRHIIKNKVYD